MSNALPRRGRPIKGRKTVVQAAFDPRHLKEIQRISRRDGKSLSSVVRDFVLDGLENDGSRVRK